MREHARSVPVVRWSLLVLVLLVLAGLTGLALAAPARPPASALDVVRRNYAEVASLVAQGTLLQFRRVFDCPEVPDAQRTVWRDASGRVRKYAFSGSMGGLAVTVSQFYLPDGRLSFALVGAMASNGTEQELRLYYGPAGMVLRQDVRRVRGPGFAFPPFWPWVVPYPEVAFNAPSPCS